MDEVLLIHLLRRRKRKQRGEQRREWYVRPLNRTRPDNGEYHSLVQDMRILQDNIVHFRYFRMSMERFDDLLHRVGPLITHAKTHSVPVSAAERLSLTLRILASGNSQESDADSYRLGKATVNKAFHETCIAIWEALKDDFVPSPSQEEWTQIAADFWLYWNFPLCLGAIDGKHVTIKAPPLSGSDFFNYKKCFSIVLMAVVDARYKFSIIDVGAYGRECDSGIYGRTDFGRRLQSGTLGIPDQAVLPGSQESCPCVFVGDEAFPLQTHMMRPYPGKSVSTKKNHLKSAIIGL